MKTEFEKMADLKQKRIAHFQDAKERSMAIMSSGRDATLIVCEIIKKTTFGTIQSGIPLETAPTDEEVEKLLRKWRKFFFYEIYGTDPDDELKQHLKETLPPKTILGF